jgi:hypothetical protein
MRKTSVTAEDILGDICAEPGSGPWSLAMKNRLQDLLGERFVNHDHLERCTVAFVKYRGWLSLQDERGRPFPSYTAFCKAPKPEGLGMRPEQIEQIIAEGRQTAEQRAEAPKGLPGQGARTDLHLMFITRSCSMAAATPTTSPPASPATGPTCWSA